MTTRKRPRGSKHKKGAATPAPFFSRSVPASSTIFKRAKAPPLEDPLESRRRLIVKILDAHGVYPEVANKIAYGMDPDRFYILRIYGYASSDPNDDGRPGDVPVLQATYVGSGTALWARTIGYAAKAPIEYVDIEQLNGPVVDRPLWWDPKESVHTVSGERVYGSGAFVEYRDRLKTGRPKKPGGGMSAKERRANRKSKDAAIKRKRSTEARAKALEAKDPVAAARLRERSKRSRKIDL